MSREERLERALKCNDFYELALLTYDGEQSEN